MISLQRVVPVVTSRPQEWMIRTRRNSSECLDAGAISYGSVMLRTRLLLLAMLIWTTAARAQAPDSVFLEELTWTELRDLVKSGKTTIIVPIGGTEQNGPHMALGKHNRRVHLLSEKIARALGNALVAPVIAY